MPLGKVLRTVIPKIEIEEVAVLISVREVSGQSLMTACDTLHDISPYAGSVYVVIVCVLKHTAHVVVIEVSPVGYLCLHELLSVA